MTQENENSTAANDRDRRVQPSYEQKVRCHDRLLRELSNLNFHEEQQLAEEGSIGLADYKNDDDFYAENRSNDCWTE
jgi:hypothetical protein